MILALLNVLAHAAIQQPIGVTAAMPGPGPFTFAVFGDNRPAKEKMPVTDTFVTITREISRIHPSFVVTTGDLIHGSQDIQEVNREYDDVLPPLQSMGVPIYFACGNHETSGGQAAEDLYKQRISAKLYYSFDFRNCHFIILDTDENGHEHSLSDAQLQWLKDDLAQRPAGTQHTFAFEHEQPHPVSSHIGSSLDIWNKVGEFEKTLQDGKVDALITGHEHLFHQQNVGGVIEIIGGGAGAPLYPSPDGHFNHYFLVTIDGEKVFYTVVKPGKVFSTDEVTKIAPESGTR